MSQTEKIERNRFSQEKERKEGRESLLCLFFLNPDGVVVDILILFIFDVKLQSSSRYEYY